MVSYGLQLAGDVFHEGLFGGERCGRVVGESDAVGHSKHVSVDSHGGFIKHYREDNVSRFSAHSRQFHQFVELRGHGAVMTLDEHLCHLYERAGLVVGEGDAFDVFVDSLLRSCGERLRRGVVAEERRSDDVHALVGALSGEDDSDEEGEWRREIERDGGIWLELVEDVADGFEDHRAMPSRMVLTCLRMSPSMMWMGARV